MYPSVLGRSVIPAVDLLDPTSAANIDSKAGGIGKRKGTMVYRETFTDLELYISKGKNPGDEWEKCVKGTDDQDATEVPYDNPVYTNVALALDSLLYVPPAISSFTLSVGTVEIGDTVTAVTASWTFNKEMTTATLTDATIDGSTSNSYAFTGLALTSNKTYTLACSDVVGNASSNKTVSFSHKRYWGPIASTSPSDADILALSSEFSSSHAKSVTYDCTGGAYPCFAFIATAGNPVVTVGGLAYSDFTVTDRVFVNSQGYSATFKILVFNGIQTGSNISVVFS